MREKETVKYLKNVKKRAEKNVAGFPTCENCGAIIKIEKNPLNAVLWGERLILEDNKFYEARADNISYKCSNHYLENPL